MKQVVVANNQWGNIGNAFYMLSLKDILAKACNDKARVVSGEDLPPAPFKGRLFKVASFFNPVLSYSPDFYVISGPVFCKDFANRWTPQLMALSRKGVKIMIMSAGSDQYDHEEKEICRAELKKIKPFILTTRDKETFDMYSDLAEYSHDGICAAFFTSYHYKGINKKESGPTCVVGFENSSEPKLLIQSIDGDEVIKVDTQNVKRRNIFQLVHDLIREHQVRFGNRTVIRPLHEPSRILTNELFRRPNRHISFNPYSYLDIYKEAEFTISERVHACVPALSYGRKAMLVKKTKRAKLFDRVGLGNISKELVSIPSDQIENEYNAYVNFLKTTISKHVG